MNIVRVIRLACVSACLAPSFLAAQSTSLAGVIGSPIDATQYPIPGVGSVNLNSGNLHIEIPLSVVKDRNGSTYGRTLQYDSSGYEEVQVTYGTTTYGAWAAFPIAHVPYINDWQSGLGVKISGVGGGQLNWTSRYLTGCTGVPPSQCGSGYTYSNWQYIDSHGTVHPFNPSATTADSTLTILGYATSVQSNAMDGSGYWLVVTNSTSAKVYDVHGNIVYPQPEDTNGNLAPSGEDKLGRPIGSLPGGWSAAYKTIYVWTKFNLGPQEIGLSPSGGQGATNGAISESVLSTLTDPDGKQYAFTYDDAGPPQGTNGTFLSTQQGHYGTVTGITLPTGAHITIQNIATGNMITPLAIHSVQTPDGEWDFTYGGSGGVTIMATAPPDSKTGLRSQTTCICSPNSTTTKTISTYSGSATGTPLITVQIQYSAIGHPSVVTTTLDGAVTSKVTYSYPDTCTPRIGSKKEYDFSGNIVRETRASFYPTTADNTALCSYGEPTFVDTYLQNGHHIVDIPFNVSVYGAGGCCTNPPVAQTNFTYDSTTLDATTGINGPSVLGITDGRGHPLHDDTNFSASMTKRGNLTQLSQMVSQGTIIPTHTYYYNILGALIRSDDGDGRTTRYDYGDKYLDSQCNISATDGYPTTMENAKGQFYLTNYNSCDGSVSDTLDPNSVHIQTQYDTLQRLSSVLNVQDNNNTTFQYSKTLPYTVTATDYPTVAQGVATVTTYDGLGRESSIVENGTITILKTYDSLGRLASVTNPYYSTGDSTFGTTKYYYDALGRMTSQTDSDNLGTKTWLYYGNLTTVSDEAGNQWESQTDALGRLIVMLEPNGISQTPTMETDYAYDPMDNLYQIDQYGAAKNNGPDHQRKVTYDAVSRITQEFNPETNWTCYGTTPPGSAPNGTNCTPLYTYGGDLVNKTDANDVVTTFGYDSLHRLVQKSYSDGTPTVKYGYDGYNASGQVLSVSNGIGRLTEAVVNANNTNLSVYDYSYDPSGRILSKSGNNPIGPLSISATYDLVGNIITLNNGLPGHPITWTYRYDLLSRLQTITANSSVDSITKLFDASATSSYGPEGLESASFGVNSSTSQPLVTFQRRADKRFRPLYGGFYNSAGTLLYSYCMPGTGNANCSGTGSPYTPNSNLANLSDSVTGTWSYSYDTLNRLASGIASSGPNSGKTACWTYDGFGNRISESLSTIACNSNPPLTSWAAYTDSNTNRMDRTSQNSGQRSYYDAAGNETFDGVNNYKYDAEGRICAVLNSISGALTGYVYDADGHRVAKSNLTSFSCNPASNGFAYTAGIVVGLNGEELTEVTGSNAWDHSNVLIGGQLFATYKGSHLYLSLNDWLGTRRAEVSVGCSPTTYGSLPFGNSLTTTGGCPYTTEEHFTGKDHDATGNEYFGARYYTSTMGRFLSADPSGLLFADPENPQSFNLYSYALNNPLKNTDPTGLYCYYGDTTEGGSDWGDPSQYDFHSNAGECASNGGTWFDDPSATVTVNGETGDSTIQVNNTGNDGMFPHLNTQDLFVPASYWGCVRSGLEGFSLQSGIQKISGGRLGKGWLAGAFFGNSVQAVGDTIQLLASGKPGSAANTAVQEAFGDTAGMIATGVSSKVPNVAVSVGVQVGASMYTPTAASSVSLSVRATANLPAGSIAQAGAGTLNKVLEPLGAFKIPYDLSVASFSAVVCGIGR